MRFFQKITTAAEKVVDLLQFPLRTEAYCKFFLLAAGVFFAGCILLVFFVDPYLHYHRAIGLKQVYGRSVAMLPGLFKHENFDTVLFGSSMAQNFDISEIDQKFNCRSIKATSAGLPAETLSVYIEKAVAAKGRKLKRCFICLDFWAFNKENVRLHDAYKYLYTDSFFVPEYFFSIDSLEAVYNAVLTNIVYPFDRTARHELDRNKMFANKPFRYKYGRKYLERTIRRDAAAIPVPGKNIRKNLEKYLFRHIRQNPDIRFDVFLPPYSIYFWCMTQKQGTAEMYLQLRCDLAEELKKLPNAELHDFQHETSVICNLENYKDCTHYSPEINSLIVKMLAEKKFSSPDIFADNAQLRQAVKKHYPEFLKLLK